MKIVFMGTPDFAATVLKALIDAGHEITAVYTQPDRPKGRSSKMIESDVSRLATEHGLTVYKPEKLRAADEVARLKTIPADIFVVAAYGQFLSEEVLNIPRLGCVNVHGSLLPDLRGASPIQRSIMLGYAKTGVTLIKMDKGMDSGDIYAFDEIPINDDDNEETMYSKLADLGAKLLIRSLPAIESGELKPVKQDANRVTFAPMLKKEEGLIDFGKSARELDCLVRGVYVWPVAYTSFNGHGLKVYSACAAVPEGAPELKPGEIYLTNKKLFVKTGEGFLELKEVQPESKKRMPAMDFARGARLTTGDRLGS